MTEAREHITSLKNMGMKGYHFRITVVS
jgi:hypothetical protein